MYVWGDKYKMNELQKVIKYFAMAFAAFLAFTIVSGIVTALFAVTGLFSISSSTSTKVDGTYNYSNVQSIDIDHSLGKLIIKTGDSDEVIVETTNVTNDFNIKLKDNGELYIQDGKNSFNIFGDGVSKNRKIVVYLPEDFVAENISIDAGAGDIELENLTTKKLVLNAGFGNVDGEGIIADSCSLESGVGNVSLNNVDFKHFDIEGGVGNIKVDGVLNGKTTVESGVGNIKLIVRDDSNNFNISVEKGIGSVKVDGNSINQMNNISASNFMSIEAGIGNIDINFITNAGF